MSEPWFSDPQNGDINQSTTSVLIVSSEMMPVEACVICKAQILIREEYQSQKNCSLILEAKHIDHLFLEEAFS